MDSNSAIENPNQVPIVCKDNLDFMFFKAILKRTDNRNDAFKLSDRQFRSIFRLNPGLFLYEYGFETTKQIEGSEYSERYDNLAIWQFLLSFKHLIFSPAHLNSAMNEFTNLYSYLNIVNVNRSGLKDKAIYRNRLFKSYLFCVPYSWEFSRHIKLTKRGVTYRNKNIGDTISKFFNVEITGNEPEKSAMINIINELLQTAYTYMTGEKLFLPYYPQKDEFSYYFFNTDDFIRLYHSDKALFYTYLDNSVDNKPSFMKRAFVYNYSLFIVSSPDVMMSELDCYSRNKEKVLDALFLSNSTLPNPVIKLIEYSNHNNK